MNIAEAAKKIGFVECEFGPDSSPCELCGVEYLQLYFGNRSCEDGREGDYWCESCVIGTAEIIDA